MGLSKVWSKKKKQTVAPPTVEEGFNFLFERGIRKVNQQDDQHRDKSYFHISSIGYCLKNLYLEAKAAGKQWEITFLKKVNIGSSIHELYQRYMAMSGNLYGRWYCKRCGFLDDAGFLPGQANCHCDDPKWEYSELHFKNDKLMVSGHPDGLFKIIKPKVILTEIKTISPFYNIGSSVKNIDKYVPEHKRQCNFYLHIMQDPDTEIEGVDKEALLDMLDLERYLLVYHDKGKDETVTYPIEADKALYEEDRARVKLFHRCIAEGVEPPAEPQMKKCKWCKFLNQCSGLED